MNHSLSANLLLIEDDPKVSSFINKGLKEEGYTVYSAISGEEGLLKMEDIDFKLVILDIMLPNMNGLEVCRNIRQKNKETPILFLTALGSAENVVLGLSSGGDDYLIKPFKFIELVARIKTLIRRSTNNQPKSDEVELLRFANIEMNDREKKVIRADMELSLTSTEYRLLRMFIKKPNKVFSRVEILEKVWEVNYELGTNVVDVYVNYLRKKLEKSNQARLIHTVIGMGYVLKEG